MIYLEKLEDVSFAPPRFIRLSAHQGIPMFQIQDIDSDGLPDIDFGENREVNGFISWIRNVGDKEFDVTRLIANQIDGLIDFDLGYINDDDKVDVMYISEGFKRIVFSINEFIVTSVQQLPLLLSTIRNSMYILTRPRIGFTLILMAACPCS